MWWAWTLCNTIFSELGPKDSLRRCVNRTRQALLLNCCCIENSYLSEIIMVSFLIISEIRIYCFHQNPMHIHQGTWQNLMQSQEWICEFASTPCTLHYLINVGVRLLIFKQNSTQHVLIPYHTFINFWKLFQSSLKIEQKSHFLIQIIENVPGL